MRSKVFNFRALTSLFLVLSGLILLVSGIALYIAPIGRVAHTINWTFLRLGKDEWEALHTVFGFIALPFAVYHLVLNWRPLCHYIASKTRRVWGLKREVVVTLLLTALIFAGTLANVPPFSSIVDLGERLGNSWTTEVGEGQGSSQEGYYEREAERSEEHELAPLGWGRMTVQEACEALGVPLTTGLERLQAHGVTASPEDRLSEIAGQVGYGPPTIAEWIAGE